jgi:hypothetical protein
LAPFDAADVPSDARSGALARITHREFSRCRKRLKPCRAFAKIRGHQKGILVLVEVPRMAALIQYICTAQHDRQEEPSVTLEQGSWAYCTWGAGRDHRWTRIDPTAIEALRSAGNGRPRLVPATPEPTTSNPPKR